MPFWSRSVQILIKTVESSCNGSREGRGETENEAIKTLKKYHYFLNPNPK